MQVSPASLRSFWNGIRGMGNLAGLIVTIPHKPAMLELIDDATVRARQVGAVNAVVLRDDGSSFGDIFDGIGCVAGLRAANQRIDGRRALIVGAGGVGSAIAFAIAEEGVREIRVADVITSRAEALAARLLGTGYAARVVSPDPAGFDLVINASPVGMRPTDPLPFDCSRLDSGAIVADVVISAELTPALRAASQRGCFVQPGSVMTDHQIPSFARFFGFQYGDWTPEKIALLSGQSAL